MCVYSRVNLYTYIYSICQQRGSTRSDTPLAMSTPAFRSWFLIPLCNKRNQGSLKKWLILGLGQGIFKMRVQYLVVPEGKELQKQK